MKNTKIQLGKEYQFAGYYWTVCELDEERYTAVIQSHGVTTGPWPGFKMSQFGNGHYYGSDIDGQDISSYDDKTQKLYDAIKDVEDMSATYGKGLYLVSAEKVQLPTTIYGASGAGYYCDAIVSAGSQGNPNGTHCNTWLGTLGNKENTAWFVNCFANGYITFQDDVIKTIAPAFNLDLSKVEIVGDEIIKKSKFDFASMVVTEQSDSSKELTDSSQYRSIWEYGMTLTKDDETLHLDPEMISQIFEAIKEDNGKNYVATYTSRKFDREQYIAICDEVENLLANDSKDVKYCACEHVLGVGFDNYAGQPAPDNLPKKLDF